MKSESALPVTQLRAEFASGPSWAGLPDPVGTEAKLPDTVGVAIAAY